MTSCLRICIGQNLFIQEFRLKQINVMPLMGLVEKHFGVSRLSILLFVYVLFCLLSDAVDYDF